MLTVQEKALEQAAKTWRDLVPADVVHAFSTTTWVLIGSIVLLLFVLACCRIFAKAGFPAATGLLMFLPGINLFLFLFFAFWPWPREREIRVLRRVHRTLHDAHGERIERGAA